MSKKGFIWLNIYDLFEYILSRVQKTIEGRVKFKVKYGVNRLTANSRVLQGFLQDEIMASFYSSIIDALQFTEENVLVGFQDVC